MSGNEIDYDPASYRDPRARVFYRDGNVLRGLTAGALETWRRVASAPFFSAMVAEAKIVPTEEVASAGSEWAAVLRHARVPVVSYPYEWPFGMLRAAADLQLEITERALADGIALRDATPFNIQWNGHRPTFIDVISFEPFEGSLWTGYRQFCELFLFPLLLQAYRSVDFHPWLRGSLDGIPANQMAALLSARDRFRPGVLTHVDLQAKLQRQFRGESSQDVDRSVRRDRAESRTIIEMNVRRLRKLVSRLAWDPPGGGWEEYERVNTYSDADREMKERFVRARTGDTKPQLTLDLGCNTGAFSRIAADASGYVVAVDSDHAVIERLYQRLAAENRLGNILPLVWDAVNPSPGLGWKGAERSPLAARLSPDLILALAVIHHLVIGRNVPLADVVDFFASFRSALIIEFVDRHDPMARHLLAQKDEQFADYTKNNFESELGLRFEIIDQLQLPSGSRSLYFARPRHGRS